MYSNLIQSESLKVILKNYQPTPLPIQAVYRHGRFIPEKVRCFINNYSTFSAPGVAVSCHPVGFKTHDLHPVIDQVFPFDQTQSAFGIWNKVCTLAK